MGNEQHSLATYVSDMLALERHIRVPFDTQKNDEDFKEYADAYELVSRLAALSDVHIDQLKATLDRLGGHEAASIKSAVTEIEGVVAGTIDKMRKTKVSKSLRDDYTALSLCCVSYSALLSTANAMGDAEVAGLAQRLLQDYAQTVLEIGDAMPGVVVQELRETGLDVDTSTIASSREQIREAWINSQEFRRGSTSTRGTIGSGTVGSEVDSALS